MMRAILILPILALAACDEPAPVVVDPPRIEITCLDPASRQRLATGSTYRDMANSRAETLRGWTLCHDALQISTQ